jgi:hypothetical protein
MVNTKVNNYLYDVLVEVDSQMEWRPTWLRRSWWLGRRYARHERSAIGPGPISSRQNLNRQVATTHVKAPSVMFVA